MTRSLRRTQDSTTPHTSCSKRSLPRPTRRSHHALAGPALVRRSVHAMGTGAQRIAPPHACTRRGKHHDESAPRPPSRRSQRALAGPALLSVAGTTGQMRIRSRVRSAGRSPRPSSHPLGPVGWAGPSRLPDATGTGSERIALNPCGSVPRGTNAYDCTHMTPCIGCTYVTPFTSFCGTWHPGSGRLPPCRPAGSHHARPHTYCVRTLGQPVAVDMK